MAIIKPFKAWRPVANKVHLVATQSVERYKPATLNAKMNENPYTFFHVIKPEFNQMVKSKIGSPELLRKIKNKFVDFCNEGIFVQDVTAGYYVYEQRTLNHSYTGIIALASIHDYFNDVIKKHENTLSERESKLKSYLEICDFNAEPVCVTYEDNTKINQLVNKIKEQNATYDFTTTDKLRHILWYVNDTEITTQIEQEFSTINALYIADGHHRSASSALLGKFKKEQNPTHTGNESYNYYMAILFPESQVHIYEFNRLVKDLNNLSSTEFIELLKTDFVVKELHNNVPTVAYEMCMYLNKRWYTLVAKDKIIDRSNPITSLDASILSDHILAPLLNITDLRTDKRVTFISGTKGTNELVNQVDSGRYQVAFSLFPATMQQVKNIADVGGVMPPKTTWVEPKLRNGLTIYSLS
jgi:uncharacterized protein (DUF1015 family)